MEKYIFTNEQRAVIEGMQIPCAVYQFINKRVVTLALSDGFCEFFGYEDRAQAYHDMDNDMYKDTHPDDVARIADEAVRFATEGGSYDVLYRTRQKGGSGYKIVHAIGKHVYTENGTRLAHVWYIDEGKYSDALVQDRSELNNIMANALKKESILKTSQYDHLTGLPRLTYFFELAEEGKLVIEKNGGRCVMLFIDLNGMKFFNSKYGFAEGDKLLKYVSRILTNMFSNENCCHIGGDHFAVYTEEAGLEEKLVQISEEVRKYNNGNSLHVRIGIYKSEPEYVPVSMAVDRAKYACDLLRDSYGSVFNYFKTDMLDKEYLRQYVVTNLDKAIKEKWIHVYYQPIVRAVNGRACDEEALARWIDPEKGFLSPADFIPYLESAGILYKLDLYVLEEVLAKLNRLKDMGLPIVPQSINLSRSDFDGCDMVEEIRRRVDDAGVNRKLITIEITESVIGSDFEYMKEQISRFRELGFPVWMDDFGSGYSSLDVLQEIPFDLIKFDMSFMQRLDKGTKGKIILTELMRMATALGVDTACEGIETEEQVHFLQEAGCSKLQGFYYQKPSPLETIIERSKNGFKVGFENPDESDYYDSIGRVNLFDLSFVASDDENVLQNIFNTIPVTILEMENGEIHYVRSNQAYREFMSRYFGMDVTDPNAVFSLGTHRIGIDFVNMLKDCCKKGGRIFYDEELDDGTVIHMFARKIGSNQITGRVAIAVAVLSVSKATDGTTYAEIARALASDYYNIYYVDLDTEHFIEYSSQAGSEEIAMERHGENFFESSRRDTMVRIYEDDRGLFLNTFTKENVVKTLDEQGVFTATYRLIDTGEPMYASMKCTRMPGSKHIIIGISIIDSQLKQKDQYDQLQRERDTMIRVMALSDGYLSLFTIDPDTGHYTEYSSSDAFDRLGAAKEGEDFFTQALIDSEKYFHPDDVENFHEGFTKENIMRDIREHGSFRIHYRLMLDGVPTRATLVIAPFREGEKERLVAGIKACKSKDKQ